MRATDYERIAATYDDLELRSRVEVHPHLERLAAAGETARALDVGCGTGTWLARQEEAGLGARLCGLDASPAMLEVARTKVSEAVELRLGDAGALPWPDAAFDLVVCNFALHHFPDKAAALSEMARTLRPGGLLEVRNISPEHTPRWWVFRFFPEARAIDAERFWDLGRVLGALSDLGLEARATLTGTLEPVSVRRRLEIARRRDISELDLLDDEAFAAGLARMEARLAEDGSATVLDETCVVTIRARASG